MSPASEQPGDSLSRTEFHQSLEDFKAVIAQTIAQQVDLSLAPLQSHQIALTAELNHTKDRVLFNETNINTNKSRIDDLQSQINDLCNGRPMATPYVRSAQSHVPLNPSCQPRASTLSEYNPATEVIELIGQGKKVLGFSPITIDNIKNILSGGSSLEVRYQKTNCQAQPKPQIRWAEIAI